MVTTLQLIIIISAPAIGKGGTKGSKPAQGASLTFPSFSYLTAY